MERITTRRSVKYNFAEGEMLEMSSELAHRNQEYRQIEEQKKSVMSDFGSKMNVVKEVISQVSDKIASGYEMRDVEFDVNYHTPEKNMKTLSNEALGLERIEKMVLADFDLFSQFVEDKEEKREEIVYNADEESEEEEEGTSTSTKKRGRPSKSIPVPSGADDLPFND